MNLPYPEYNPLDDIGIAEKMPEATSHMMEVLAMSEAFPSENDRESARLRMDRNNELHDSMVFAALAKQYLANSDVDDEERSYLEAAISDGATAKTQLLFNNLPFIRRVMYGQYKMKSVGEPEPHAYQRVHMLEDIPSYDDEDFFQDCALEVWEKVLDTWNPEKIRLPTVIKDHYKHARSEKMMRQLSVGGIPPNPAQALFTAEMDDALTTHETPLGTAYGMIEYISPSSDYLAIPQIVSLEYVDGREPDQQIDNEIAYEPAVEWDQVDYEALETEIQLVDADFVHELLSGLPTTLRETLQLYYFEELTFEEIGALYGITGAGARARAVSGLTQMRAIISASDAEVQSFR